MDSTSGITNSLERNVRAQVSCGPSQRLFFSDQRGVIRFTSNGTT
jgi:hypothetical protein